MATAIDSQSVKSAQTVSKAARGYDAGKKINASDTWSSTPADFPSWSWPPADLHDPAAAERGLFCLRLMRPEITIVWADSAFAGKLVDWAKQHLGLTIKPVSWLEDASGFIMLPRRWVLAVLPG